MIGPAATWFTAPAFAWRIDCGVTISAGTSTPSCDDLLQDDLQETLEDHERGVVYLDARDTRGLSRVTGDLDWKTEALSVMLGWTFAPRW